LVVSVGVEVVYRVNRANDAKNDGVQSLLQTVRSSCVEECSSEAETLDGMRSDLNWCLVWSFSPKSILCTGASYRAGNTGADSVVRCSFAHCHSSQRAADNNSEYCCSRCV
jgi:hypothetical protein